MEASRKRFVALFSIAVVSQALIVGLPAKAEEKVNLQIAQNKLEEGDYEQALRYYDILLKQGITTADIHYGRGRSLQELGKNEQSLESYTKMIEIDPKNAIAYSNRGLVYGSLGKIKLALNDFNTAIALDPNFENAR